MLRKNLLSSIVALVIIFLSFAEASTFNRIHIPRIPHADKIVHFIMYFTLMSVLIWENRKVITAFRNYLYLAIIPLLFGGIIEIMQSMFTRTRTGDIFDFCANTVGIMTAASIWYYTRKLLRGRTK